MVGEQRFIWWVAGQSAAWAARNPVETVAITALVANPTTRTWAAKSGWMLAKESARFTARVGVRSAALTYSELVAGSRLATLGGTAGVYAGAVGAGLLLGSVAGTAISGALFGKEGAKDAMRLYSGQVGWKEYKKTVGRLF